MRGSGSVPVYGIVLMVILHTMLIMSPIFSICPLKQSPIYIGYLIAIQLFAFRCTAMVLPIALHVIVLFCLIVSFLFFLERDQGIIFLQYNQKTEWMLYCNNDRVLRMQLLSSSVMTRYFLILHFTGEKVADKKSLVLFSDMLSPENYRHLRRCVKIGFL